MLRTLIISLLLLTAGALSAQDVFVADSSGETSVTFRPGNQNIIVGGSNGYRGDNPIALSHRTLTGGYTSNDWSTVQMALPSDKELSGDPIVDYDSNGNVYYCLTAFELENGDYVRGGIFLYKSTNNGATWSSPITVDQPEGQDFHDDKPWMMVDRTRTPNRIYVAWTLRHPQGSYTVRDLRFSYALTTDPNNFSEPITLRQGTVDALGWATQNWGAAIAVAPNGNMYISWVEDQYKGEYKPNASNILVTRSTDGGGSFGSLITVKSNFNPAQRSGAWGSFRFNSFPTIVASPTTGYIHLAWCEDLESGGHILQLHYKRSTDGGQNWINEGTITPPISGYEQWSPFLSVNQTGRLFLTFYNFKDSSPQEARLYSQISTNNGSSFGNSYPHATVSSNPYWGLGVTDYIGAIAPQDNPLPTTMWQDYRNATGFYDRQGDVFFDQKLHLNSSSPLATASNNQRKIIQGPGANEYHLVYQANGEIWYTKTTDGGTNWTPESPLSNRSGSNSYPSITRRDNIIFVVWQRQSSTNSYDIYFAKYNGSSWSSPATITRLSGLTCSTDPLPVVSYKVQGSNCRVLVCAKGQRESYNGILYQYSDSPNEGSSWLPTTDYKVAATISSHKNQSLSMGPTTPTTDSVYVVYDDGSTIYYNAYKSSWRSNSSNLSSGCGTYNNRYPSVEVDGSSGRNFAWQGYSTPLEMTVIVHRRNNETFQIFANGGDGGNRPSITGLTSNKRAIVCTSDNFTDIFKFYYNGSSWSRTLVASNGQHPTLSAGATTAKYAWTSGTAAPYEIKISTESLSKSSLENWAYHRAAVLQDTSHSSLLWIEVGEITLATSRQEFAIAQTSIQDQDLNLNATELFNYLDSEPFVIPADSTQLIWYQQLYGQGLSPLTATPTSDLKITTQLIDAATESELATLHQATLVSGSDSSRLKGALLQDVSAYKGRQVKIRVVVAGLAAKMAGVVPGVTEIHLLNPTGFNKPYPEKNDKLSAEQPETFRLFQNFPNPFNPATEIHYQLPEAAQVRLVIYTLLGQHIRTLVEQRQPAGDYSVNWDGKDAQGRNLASGIYIYCLEAGSFIASKKLAVVR